MLGAVLGRCEEKSRSVLVFRLVAAPCDRSRERSRGHRGAPARDQQLRRRADESTGREREGVGLGCSQACEQRAPVELVVRLRDEHPREDDLLENAGADPASRFGNGGDVRVGVRHRRDAQGSAWQRGNRRSLDLAIAADDDPPRRAVGARECNAGDHERCRRLLVERERADDDGRWTILTADLCKGVAHRARRARNQVWSRRNADRQHHPGRPDHPHPLYNPAGTLIACAAPAVTSAREGCSKKTPSSGVKYPSRSRVPSTRAARATRPGAATELNLASPRAAAQRRRTARSCAHPGSRRRAASRAAGPGAGDRRRMRGGTSTPRGSRARRR